MPKEKQSFILSPFKRKKKKPREVVNYLEIFSFVQYQCLYFYSNTSYVIINQQAKLYDQKRMDIQIHLMLLLISHFFGLFAPILTIQIHLMLLLI